MITTTEALQAYYSSLLSQKSAPGMSPAATATAAFNQIVSDCDAGLIDPGIAAAFLVPLINSNLIDPNIASAFLAPFKAPLSTTNTITTAPALAAYYLSLVQAKSQPGTFAVPSGAIVGASNANPLVITAAAAHGLNPTDRVINAGVGGNTNANGTFTVATTPTPESYTLFQLGNTTPIAGNGTYTQGGSFRRANVNDLQGVGHTTGISSAQAAQAAAAQIVQDANNNLIDPTIAETFLTALQGATIITPIVGPTIPTEITDSGTLQAYYNGIVAAKQSALASVPNANALAAQFAFNQIVHDTKAGLIDSGVAAAFLIPLVPNTPTAIATRSVNSLLGL